MMDTSLIDENVDFNESFKSSFGEASAQFQSSSVEHGYSTNRHLEYTNLFQKIISNEEIVELPNPGWAFVKDDKNFLEFRYFRPMLQADEIIIGKQVSGYPNEIYKPLC